ncbi:unnamed protein product [Didymodactylos carnosus]|uniref:Uncharacterized protein n=1 Tax=Didymodactylos carnosus TaxID=1234261 RepID=A0A814W2N8_9BILA|nr:unnamed protein product [Didymodactylos carnosus]CAF1193210.1 unnamed protein product [Didymodactylos carnosus]CAF3674607.1 unnamed protein product [Didymodactylos carnosus]CAF3957436.1 unnamed protein product [Didymodactylos carnosus]
MSKSTGTAVEATTGVQSAAVHTAVSDDVRVRSVVTTETLSTVNMENSAKINELMKKLGSTHSQIDDYSKRRTDEISDAVQASIVKIVNETQLLQENLLLDANKRHATVEQDYKIKLQHYVDQLDQDKAKTLAQLEKDLNTEQEHILEQARKRIDDLNDEANRMKINVLKEAQQAVNAKVETITDQVAQLGHDDTARRLQSTTTTVITTQAKAEGIASTTKVVDNKNAKH